MNNQNTNVNTALDWNSEITQENNFVLLPEGEYDFKVEKFERGHFSGSDKMSACPMAVLQIKLYSQTGETTVIKHNLLLHSKTEWSLSAFFASIGLKKKNEPLRMNWQLVTGATGRCKVGVRSYNGNDYNEIKKFIPAYEIEKKPAYTQGTF